MALMSGWCSRKLMAIYWTFRRYSKQKWKESDLKIHNKFEIILHDLYGENIAWLFKISWEYVFYTKNPLAQILGLQSGAKIYCTHTLLKVQPIEVEEYIEYQI